ncbi:unnamed protein product, partial [Onchocerca flexuosa]|uniref:Metallophos domain-containing protein n=1 Tax=Onchocerca flexuosa TaxID=387005 RepID=A0A183I383_9BILA
VNRVNVKIRNLPLSLDGFTIVLLTDVHIGPTVGEKRIEEIVAKTNELHADMVAISGDLVDGFLSNLVQSTLPLANLKSKYGVYYATGNHEYYYGNTNEWLHYFTTKFNITVLRNTNRNLCSSSGDCICVAGVDDLLTEKLRIPDHHMDAERALSGCSETQPVILLVHQPNAASKILHSTKKRIDLILSGHTHAGQFYVVWLFVYLKNDFLHGLYRMKSSDTQIYVSSGVNYWGPPNMILRITHFPTIISCIISATSIVFLNIFGLIIFGVNDVYDYRKGNRERQLSTLKFEFFIFPFSVFVYFRLIEFAKYVLTYNTNGTMTNHATKVILYILTSFSKNHFKMVKKNIVHKIKCIKNNLFQCLQLIAIGTMLWLFLGHATLFLYFIPDLIPRFLVNLSFLSIGLWYHIVIPLVVFAVLTAMISGLKNITLNVKDLPDGAKGIRFALISDIHAGAAVFEEQVEKIVDRVNSQAVDAVLIVGDAIDAPRNSIENRVRSLRYVIYVVEY